MLFYILLALTSSLALILAYQNRSLKKEHARLREGDKEDSKVLYLTSRYASMGETVGNIAHQWKQPLNAIGAIQNSIKAALIFQGDIPKDKLLSSVETSFKLLQHLAETIDTFYSFLSQRSNEKRNFKIADELEKVRKITEYSFENSRIQLDFELDTNPMILGNPNEFTHAILNLILNAKDAFDTTTVNSPLITVHVRGGEKTCTITVADNAGGIRLKPIDIVFDLHITTKEDGSGLGLFMTKNIIENRFGGNISVKNIQNGACFTIEIPYAEYSENFSDTVSSDEKLTLDRITQLSRKIIELEEIEKALQKWADIFKKAHWAIAIHIGTSNNFESTNEAFNSLYGYTPQEVKDITVPDLFPPETLSILSDVQKEAFENGYTTFETVNKRKDGSTFPVSVELIAIKDENGEILYHIANIWDLSEKKAAEGRLLLKKFALDHIKDSVFMIDENARFHYVNQGACNALGYTREEFEHMNVGDVDPDWPVERWLKQWEALKNAGSITMELRHRRKDGTLFPVEVSANFIKFDGHYYNMAIARDITERRLLEAEKENRIIRTVAENSPDVIIRYDVEGRRIYANPKAGELLGVEIGKSPSEATPIIDKELYVSELQNVIKTGVEATFEITYINAAGGIDYSHIRMVPEFDDHENIVSVLMIGRNVTEYKQILEALKVKEQELRALAESSPGMMGIYYMRPDGSVCIPYASPNIRELFGITPEEIKEDATPLMALSHPDDAEMIVQTIQKSAQNMSLWHIEYRIIHPTKGVRWMEGNTMPQPHPDGGVIWYGYVHDITERKWIEMALEKSEQILQEAQRIAHVGSWDVDIVNDVLTWSDETYRIWEIDKEHFEATLAAFLETVHPEDRELVAKTYNDSIINRTHYEVEHRLLFPNGRIKYIHERGEPHYDPDGKPIRFIGTCLDITERKAMENELRKALEFNEGVISAIPDLLFEITPDGTYVGIWAQDEALLAAQKEVLLGKDFKEILPPNVVITLLQTLKEVDEKGHSLGKIFNLDLPVGKKWFELSVSKKKSGGNYIILSRDITERKELEALLEKEHKFLSDAQHVAHTGSWYLDIPNGLLTWSDETYRIFELEKEGIDDLHKTFYEIVHPDDREMVQAPYVETLNARLPYELEHRIVMKDGRIKYVIERCEHTYDYDGTPLYSVGTVQDITERKVQEEKLNKLYELSPLGIALTDINGRYIEFNDAFCKICGYTLDELQELDYWTLTPIEYEKQEFEQLELLKRTGRYGPYEKVYRQKNGNLIPIQLNGVLIKDENGDEYIWSIVEDISERKRMESLIQESNERYIQILDNSTDVIYLIEVTPDGRFIYVDVNAAYEEVTGIPRDIVIGLNVEDIEDETFRSILIDKFTTCLNAEGKTDYIADYPFPIGLRTFHSVLAPIRDKSGRIVRIVGAARDITEKKLMEKELEESHQFLNDLIDAVPDPIFVKNRAHTWILLNQAFCNLSGMPKEALIGKSDYDIFPKEEADIFWEKDEIVFNSNETNVNEEYFTSADGTTHYIQTVKTMFISDSKGEHLAGTIRDITERKNAEETIKTLNTALEKRVLERTAQLQEAVMTLHRETVERVALEERLSKIAATVPGVNYIFEKTVEGIVRFTYLAPTFEELFGLSADAAMEDFSVVMEHIHPDDREMIRQSIVDTARDFTNWHEEFRILHPQKEIVWIEGQSSPELQDNGSILWYGFFHDATERKNAEEALAQSEETFRALVENSPDVISRYDLSMRRTYVNPMMRFLLDKPLDEILGKTPREFSPLPDVELFEEMFKAVVYGKTELEHEGLYQTPWGEMRWGNQRLIPELDSDQNVTGVMVIGRDMSERIETEKRLMMVETAINSTTEAIYINDTSLKIIYVNDGACRMLGYSREELLSMHIVDIDAQYTPDEIHEFKDSTLDEPNIVFETCHRRKDGSIIDVEIVGTSFAYDSNEIILSVVKEITERKKMEKALRYREEYQRTLLDNFPYFVWLKDKESRLLAANIQYARVANVQSTADLVGKTDFDFFPHDLSTKYVTDDQSVMKEGKSKNVEEQYADEHGNIRWMETWKSPVWVNQEIVGTVGCSRDITERKNSEKELKLLETAINYAEEAVYIIDDNRLIIYVNDAACRMSGYTKEELEGKSILDIDVHFSEKDICTIFDNSPSKTKFTFKTKHRTKEGKILNVEVNTNRFIYDGVGFGVSLVKEIVGEKV